MAVEQKKLPYNNDKVMKKVKGRGRQNTKTAKLMEKRRNEERNNRNGKKKVEKEREEGI